MINTYLCPDEPGEEGEAPGLLDQHPVVLGLAEGPQGVGSTAGAL